MTKRVYLKSELGSSKGASSANINAERSIRNKISLSQSFKANRDLHRNQIQQFCGKMHNDELKQCSNTDFK
jgi:hypothetical protein